MCDKLLGTLPADLRPAVRDALLELGRKCHAHAEHAFLIEVNEKLSRAKRRRDEHHEALLDEREKRLAAAAAAPPPTRKHVRTNPEPHPAGPERREKTASTGWWISKQVFTHPIYKMRGMCRVALLELVSAAANYTSAEELSGTHCVAYLVELGPHMGAGDRPALASLHATGGRAGVPGLPGCGRRRLPAASRSAGDVAAGGAACPGSAASKSRLVTQARAIGRADSPQVARATMEYRAMRAGPRAVAGGHRVSMLSAPLHSGD
jgi:hypothetical protein